MDGDVTRRGMWLGNYGMNITFPKLSFLPRNLNINADTRTQTSGETVTNTSSSGVTLSSVQDMYKADLGYTELLSENLALGKTIMQSQLTKNMYGNFLFSKKGMPSFSLSLQGSKTQNQLTGASSDISAYQFGVRHSFGKLSVSLNQNVAQQSSSQGFPVKTTDTSMDASYVIPIERHSTVVVSFLLRKSKSGSGTANASILETNVQSRLTPSLSLSHRFSYQKQSTKGKSGETVMTTDEMTGFNYSLNSFGLLRLSFQNQEQNNGKEIVTLSYLNAGGDFTLSPDASLFLNYSRARKSPQGSILTWTHSDSYGATVNLKFFKGSLLNYTLLYSKAKEENSSTISMNLTLMSEIYSTRYETLNGTYTRTWQKATKPDSSAEGVTETLGLTYLLRPDSKTTWTFTLLPSRSSGKIQQKDILLSVSMAQIVSPALTVNQSYSWKKTTVGQPQLSEARTQDYSLQLNWQLPRQSLLGLRMQFTRNNPGNFKEYRNFSMNYSTMF